MRRGRMGLASSLPPNPRLQRTGLRLPLSRKPLGVGRVSCAPARRAEPELGHAETPQAASGRVSRMTVPALGPVTLAGG
jgi:hypothetical protein